MNRRGFLGQLAAVCAAVPAVSQKWLEDAGQRGRDQRGGGAIPNLGEKITIRQVWQNSRPGTAPDTLVLTVGSLSIYPDELRLILGGRADDGTVYTLDLNLAKFTRQPDGSFLWTVA